MTSKNADTLAGYVGSTDDPAGAGTLVATFEDDNNSDNFIMFFVPNGKYFEVTHASETPTIIWTPLVSGGAAPVDQD